MDEEGPPLRQGLQGRPVQVGEWVWFDRPERPEIQPDPVQREQPEVNWEGDWFNLLQREQPEVDWEVVFAVPEVDENRR